MEHQYTVFMHPTGCRVIEGRECRDIGVLLRAWGVFTEDAIMALAMSRRGTVHVCHVVGTESQLAALRALLSAAPNPEPIEG